MIAWQPLGSGLLLSMAVGRAPLAAAPSLVVTARDGGSLVINNPTTAAIRIDGAVIVEGFDGARWKPLITEMNLVAACRIDGVVEPAPPVSVKSSETLTPPPWRGWSCSGQCETHCRNNAYWGAGPFRFRLTAGTTSFISNAFRMPLNPRP